VLKVQSGIRVHAWRLYEGLELVSGVSGGSFNSENAFDWLLAKNGISESVSDMGKFLIVAPINLVFATSVVIVMSSCGSVLQHLLVIEFLSLREPGTCGFSPSVVVFEEAVVEMSVSLHREFKLVKALWNVTFRVKVFGSNLSDMKVNQVAVVAVKLKQLISFEASCVNVVLNVNVLMGQDVMGLSVLVAWRVDVVNFEISLLFVLVDSEEKVLS